jgi:hypothetical protein
MGEQLLPGAVVGREWMKVPMGEPESKQPEEWAAGLWGLDAAVRDAIRGGWTDNEIQNEVATLIRSYRAFFSGASVEKGDE